MSQQFVIVQVDNVKEWEILTSEKDQYQDLVSDMNNDEEDTIEEIDNYDVSELYEKFNVIAIGENVRNWITYDKIQDTMESELSERPIDNVNIDMSKCIVFGIKTNQEYMYLVQDMLKSKQNTSFWSTSDKSVTFWYTK